MIFRNGGRGECSILPMAASPCFLADRWNVVKAATNGMSFISPTVIWILVMCSLIHDGVLMCTEQRVREPRKQRVGEERRYWLLNWEGKWTMVVADPEGPHPFLSSSIYMHHCVEKGLDELRLL